MIIKTTAPTIKFPPTANSPNVKIISPASACKRISLVVEIFRPTLKRVVNKSNVGKDEKLSTFGAYIVIIRITKDIDRFAEISRSTHQVGRGTTISAITATTIPTNTKSA